MRSSSMECVALRGPWAAKWDAGARRAWIVAIAAIAAIAALGGVACGPPQGPARGAASPEIAAGETAMDELFREVANDHAPGCAIAVAKGGEVVFRKGYGMARIAEKRPMTPETVSQVASISKQLTGHAVAMLAVQGKLSLDDPLKRHLADFVGSPLGEVRLGQLMFHTSGIRDYYDLRFLQGAETERETTTQAQALDLLHRQKTLSFRSGTEFGYSNSNYLLLAEVVSRVAKMPFSSFAEQQIFAPRNMERSRFLTSEELKNLPENKGNFSNIAEAYAKDKEGSWKEATPGIDTFGPTGLYTSADDLLRWARSFDAAKEGDPVVAHRGARGSLSDGTPVDYGYGLIFMTYKGHDVVRHAGGHGPYRAVLYSLPAERAHIAITCNARVVNLSVVLDRAVDTFVLNDTKPPPRPPSPDRAELDRRAGPYFSAEIDEFWDVAASDAGLSDPLRGAFAPMPEGAFLAGQTSLVKFEGEGEAMKLLQRDVLTPRAAPFVFMRIKPSPLTDAQKGAFIGKYESAEVGVPLEVAQGEKGLVAILPKRRLDLAPLAPDVLQSPDLGVIRLSRDGAGNVDAVSITLGATARHVRFDRVKSSP